MEWEGTGRGSAPAHLLLYAVLLLLLISGAAVAQTNDTGLVGPEEEVRLPDGILGRPLIRFGTEYSSVSGDPGSPVFDGTRFRAHSVVPVHERFSLTVDWDLRHQDSVRYQVLAGLRWYAGDPITDYVNADGPVGRPVITVRSGWRFSSRPDSNRYWLAGVDVAVPVSSHLTVAVGYRHFDVLEFNEVREYSAELTMYFAEYQSDEVYRSPDGPPGLPVVKVGGGASSLGYFGEAMLLFPLNENVSTAVIGRGEWLDDPFQKSLTLGAELSLRL